MHILFHYHIEKPMLEDLPEKFRNKVLEQLPTTIPLRFTTVHNALCLNDRGIGIYIHLRISVSVCYIPIMSASQLTSFLRRATGSGAAEHAGVCATSAATTSCGNRCSLRDTRRSWWSSLCQRNQIRNRYTDCSLHSQWQLP